MIALLALVLAGAIALPASAAQPPCPECDRFYEMRAGEPAWTGAANIERRTALAEAVEQAAAHGLDPEDYDIASLRAPDAGEPLQTLDRRATRAYFALAGDLLNGRADPRAHVQSWSLPPESRDLAAHLEAALETGRIGESLEALAPADPDYRALQAGLASYRERAAGKAPARLETGEILRPGDTGPRIVALRARLGAIWPDLAPVERPDVYDPALAEAVREFQRRHGLKQDGLVGNETIGALNTPASERIDQIRVNLERLRWLPEDLGPRHVRVNIPAFELETWQAGERAGRHRVIVGRTSRPTPVFSAPIRRVVTNPWWETPHSLAVRDELPLFRRDPGAVARLGFIVLDQAGNRVDPATIDWSSVSASDFPYRLRQAPGPLNALGEVKLLIDSPYSVHLHDTPARQLFATWPRAYSSGCIRVEGAVDLAAWALGQAEPEDGLPVADRVSRGETRTLELADPLPVHVLYFTAVADEQAGARFFPDLYDRDRGVLTALDQAPAEEVFDDRDPRAWSERAARPEWSDEF